MSGSNCDRRSSNVLPARENDLSDDVLATSILLKRFQIQPVNIPFQISNTTCKNAMNTWPWATSA